MFDLNFWTYFLGVVIIGLVGYIIFDRRRRNKEIAQLTEEIDKILHNCETYSLSDYGEGELSILRNELSKMTLMLRSQAEQLSADKVHLADALADISHQIRTPLTSLNIMLATVKNPNTEPEKRAQTLYEMSRQLERIDRLVVSLLKMAKMDAGTIKMVKEEVSLEDLIENCLQSVEIMLEVKEITVEKQVSGTYLGDRVWTEEAITNIIKNCAEHMEVGGRLIITGMENAVYSEITIADNGHGILKDNLPHIFDRFYKGENSSNNSFGIGLALAKSIIQGQNGTIKAENVLVSNENDENQVGGARFIIRFYKGII